MWVKATKERFEEVSQVIETERQLSDGDYIKHFELTGSTMEAAERFVTKIRMNMDFDLLTNDQMAALLENEPNSTQ